MRKSKVHLLTLFLSFVFYNWNLLNAQSVIHQQIYTVNFSQSLKQPLWVSYKLYKGGGNCERKKFRFKNDIDTLHTATDKDYAKSGYDKGHLANAEDFAYECSLDEATFRYYNCIPQTPNLNRGIWKKKETEIREWSQTDSLLIICGGKFGKKKFRNLSVPDYCWKVVQSLSTKKILFCGWFKNSENSELEDITINELKLRINTSIYLKK